MSNEVDRTLWAGNLSDKITEELLYELFLQAGPLDKVKIATDKEGRKRNFAFITFSHDASVPYTMELMNGMQLLGRNLNLQARPGSVHMQQQQQQQQAPPQYSNNQPAAPNPPYKNNMPMQMSANPYMMNQPMKSQGGSQQAPPSFHRSNTWHGSDLSTQERDHGDRSRERDRYSNRDRDRSGQREDYNASRDNYRGSSNYRDNGRNEDFEAKRQRVLQQQGEVSNRYKKNQYQQRSSPQHPSNQGYSNRRGRY